jgi:hypothetical protein
MDARRRLPLVGGLLLIALGALLLAGELVPDWDIEFTWPWIIILVGLGLLVLGLLTGQPAMAVPACIVGGIGGILYYQDVTQDWASWAYLWPLIPGFAGVGTILAGLLGGYFGRAVRDGGKSILFSLVGFLVMAALLGRLGELGRYWPVLLILAGVVALVSALLPRRTRSQDVES